MKHVSTSEADDRAHGLHSTDADLMGDHTGSRADEANHRPVIFGVITSTVDTLVSISVSYALYKRYEQWKEARQEQDETSSRESVTNE